MEEKDIKEILQIILNNIEGKEFFWRVEGSANLKIQGVEVSVNDLDITTNDDGIKIFREVLNEFIVKDFFSHKINGLSLIFKIHGFEVEINSYKDRKIDMIDKTKIIQWHNLQVPILPLKYAKEF